jgi:hypothetical protein
VKKKQFLLISAVVVIGILTAVASLSAATGTSLINLASQSGSEHRTSFVVTFLAMDGSVIVSSRRL